MTSIFDHDALVPLVDAAYRGDFSASPQVTPRFSATSIKTFILCERQYYWQNVAGLPNVPSTAQIFGTRGHAFLERYLKTGEIPSAITVEGATAASCLDNLPASGTPGLKVEDGFVVPWQLANGDRIKVTGTADFHVAPLDKEDDTFLLGDHKFIKSIARYAMSRQELADDVQANLYAHIFFERYRGEGFKNLDFVTKRWNYVQKEKEKDRFISKAVEVTNTREQVARVVDKVIEPALSGMHALVTEKPRLFDVPYNENACSMYGGCVNRSRCFGEKAMAFKIAPTKGAEKEKGSNIMGVISHASNPQQQQSPAVAQNASKKITRESLVDQAKAIRHAATDVNPPPVAPTPIFDQAMARKKEIEAEQESDPQAEAPKQRASRKVQTAAPAAHWEDAPADDWRQRALGYNPEHSYWLFIGCAPTKGFPSAVHDVSALTADAAQMAMQMTKKESHYRMEFGGHGLLQAAFDRWMGENAVKGAVVVPTGSVAGSNVIDTLRVHAAMVVEKVGL